MEIKNQIRKIKVNEILVPLLCAAGILYAGASFVFEMSGRSGGTGEQVGSISYRYRVAQKRSTNRVVWEDVEQQDTIFNRDSVRTDEKSEAIITLKNGARLELDPQSMIVLNYEDGEATIQVESGSVLLRDVKPGMRLMGPAAIGPGFAEPRADTRLTVEGDSARISGDFEMNVNAVRSEGRSVLLNRSGLREVRREDRALSPEDNARFFADEAEAPVLFQWKTPPDSIELAEDRFFEKPLAPLTGNGNAARQFSEGVYYWRPKGAPLTDVRKFRVIRRPLVQLLRPGLGETISLSTSPFAVFAWTESRLAQSYTLQISRDRNFAQGVTEKSVLRTGISLSLPAGTYFWRVEARGSLNGSNRQSVTGTFTVLEDRVRPSQQPPPRENGEKAPNVIPEKKTEEAADLRKEKPVPLFPAGGQVVDMSQAEQIIFTWKPSPGASTYRLDLLRGAQVVYSGQSTEPRLLLSDLSVLDVGDFTWRVSARYPDGSEEVSAPAIFRIFLASQPDRPTLKTQ